MIPHFEKMLYDNGIAGHLRPNRTATGDPFYATVALKPPTGY